MGPNRTKNVGSVTTYFYPHSATDGEYGELDSTTCSRVFESWKGCLSVVPLHSIDSNVSALRQPQISALFSLLSHFSSHKNEDVTVVMPTGTGKTETMIAAICGFPVRRPLIIVPSVSLRDQTARKLRTLGMLRDLNAIKCSTQNPVVSVLEGGVRTDEEYELVAVANVVISTPQSIHNCDAKFKDKLFRDCTHLFVDEAHHVKAPTWAEIKRRFEGRHVVQFTATPFRQDRKKVGGRIIYNYPMSLAQQNGLFRKIQFESVYEISQKRGDSEIARLSVNALRRDLEGGFDHILMARCNSKKRADEIFQLYDNKYSDLKPVLIYSGIRGKSKKDKAIRNKEHRIVVCVNMLGEGFDLPELKVCALHDIHKSLPITLQFAGRFVRDRPDLGDPTFVTNVCDQEVEDCLKDLYKEDPDWNKALRRSSESTIEHELQFQELVDDAVPAGVPVPLENLNPAMSCIVYRPGRGSVSLDPNEILLDRNEALVSSIEIPTARLLLLVTRAEAPPKWAPQSDFELSELRLIIAYYSTEHRLLFIHDSSKSGSRAKLAKSINPHAKLVFGDTVFKSFGEIERLVLQNAGLNRGRKGPLRYVMYTGIDIEEAINDLAQGSSYKSNLFGKGYQNGEKVTVGSSYKGRIWSMNSGSLMEWQNWCRRLGDKLNSSSIDPNHVLQNVLRTRVLDDWPDALAIAVDWPEKFYMAGESSLRLISGAASYDFDDVTLELVPSDETTDGLQIKLSTNEFETKFRYRIDENGFSIKRTDGPPVSLSIGESKSGFSEYFETEEFLSVHLADATLVFGNQHVVRPPGFGIPKIDKKSLRAVPWTCDITKESQGPDRRKNTIQFEAISRMDKSNYFLIFDDDGPNEIADIVGVKLLKDRIVIELHHLKYSSRPETGSRIEDVDRVCGQAIKSCKWVGEFDDLLDRIKKRERRRVEQGKSTRFEKSEYRQIEQIRQHARRMRKEYRIYVVQPGLDVANVSEPVLGLLGATDLYVRETTGFPMVVTGS